MCEPLFFELESGKIINLFLIRSINTRKRVVELFLIGTEDSHMVEITFLELEEIKKLLDVRRLK